MAFEKPKCKECDKEIKRRGTNIRGRPKEYCGDDCHLRNRRRKDADRKRRRSMEHDMIMRTRAFSIEEFHQLLVDIERKDPTEVFGGFRTPDTFIYAVGGSAAKIDDHSVERLFTESEIEQIADRRMCRALEIFFRRQRNPTLL